MFAGGGVADVLGCEVGELYGGHGKLVHNDHIFFFGEPLSEGDVVRPLPYNEEEEKERGKGNKTKKRIKATFVAHREQCFLR